MAKKSSAQIIREARQYADLQEDLRIIRTKFSEFIESDSSYETSKTKFTRTLNRHVNDLKRAKKRMDDFETRVENRID